MNRRLSQMEAEEAAKVAAFLDQHPEFDTDPEMREQYGPERAKVLPMDLSRYDHESLFGGVGREEDPALRLRVNRALETLNERDQRMLERRFMERMTLDAIAAEERVSRQAVLKRLTVAKRRFRQAYEQTV